MKEMFIKVFMNDDCGETLDIHGEEIKGIENDIKSYLNKEGYHASFYYHQAAYYGEDFVEVSHEGDLSDKVVEKLCELLKGITVEGGLDSDADKLTLNMDYSLKYINFIKLDKCVKL